jgi:hypothetical protein
VNALHFSGSIVLEAGGGTRLAVEEGSNFWLAGVKRAFKFWLMVSSIVALDTRRNSVWIKSAAALLTGPNGRAQTRGEDTCCSILTFQSSGIETELRREWRMVELGRRRVGHVCGGNWSTESKVR